MYIFIGAGLLQTLGLALMSSVAGAEHGIPSALYGYQVITGIGFGISMATVVMAIPMLVDKRDLGLSKQAIQ